MYECYNKGVYVMCYGINIFRLIGERYWFKVNMLFNLNFIKIGFGRLRKNRRKDFYEDLKRRRKLIRYGIKF